MTRKTKPTIAKSADATKMRNTRRDVGPWTGNCGNLTAIQTSAARAARVNVPPSIPSVPHDIGFRRDQQRERSGNRSAQCCSNIANHPERIPVKTTNTAANGVSMMSGDSKIDVAIANRKTPLTRTGSDAANTEAQHAAVYLIPSQATPPSRIRRVPAGSARSSATRGKKTSLSGAIQGSKRRATTTPDPVSTGNRPPGSWAPESFLSLRAVFFGLLLDCSRIPIPS